MANDVSFKISYITKDGEEKERSFNAATFQINKVKGENDTIVFFEYVADIESRSDLEEVYSEVNLDCTDISFDMKIDGNYFTIFKVVKPGSIDLDIVPKTTNSQDYIEYNFMRTFRIW